ncbi:MAG: magnesium transporter [Pseudomonadota bacterium]
MTDVQTEEPIEVVTPAIRDENGALSGDYVSLVKEAVSTANRDALFALDADLHEADVAHLLEVLPPDERRSYVRLLGDDFDFATLTELDETVRDQILDAVPNEAIAEAVQELDSDDAVYILEDLDFADQTEILGFIPEAERISLQRGLDYPDDSAGRRMQKDFVAVPPFWTVGDAIDHARETIDLPDEFYELFVVDPAFHFVGTVPLYRLLRTKRPVRIEDIMEPAKHSVGLLDDQEEVARLFERYNLVSAPVLDDNERMVGVITHDDIMDIIEEEAEEDMKRLAGVGDEGISDTIMATARYRFPWLFINLLTAVLASAVISLFDGVIEQIVALAVLMPIVASMGGNAGTQSLTVAVRALAMQELTTSNARRVVTREVVVGLLNGIGFAVILGVLGGWWAEDWTIGWVLAAAMIVNMLVAGLSGILIPIVLDKLKLDPALSSAVFVTTVTDVVGFFAFLGLAAWAFGLL